MKAEENISFLLAQNIPKEENISRPLAQNIPKEENISRPLAQNILKEENISRLLAQNTQYSLPQTQHPPLESFKGSLTWNSTCSILMRGMKKGVRKLFITSKTSSEAPIATSLFSSLGRTFEQIATLLTNFPTTASSKPRPWSVATSLTDSLDISHLRDKNKMTGKP